jgi:hypothetical protein
MRETRHSKDWLKVFQQVFGDTEVPNKYIFWVGVGTIAGALQRNVCFNQETFKLYPNHYIILVGPPAIKKTTAINYGVNRLRNVEGINVGPSTVTWQYLVDKLIEIQTPTAEETALTGIALRDSCPIVLPAGELGTLIDFDERSAIDFFTNAWDSPDQYDKGTRIMGDQMVNGPCPTIISGTTPQWIADNVKGSIKGGGFISRCIMPYENRPAQVITYPKRHMKNNHNEVLSHLEHDLAIIASLHGDYEMTPEAEELGESWHKKTSAQNYNKQLTDDSDNWSNRRYSHVHKLAMVIAASKRNELVITKEDLQEAIERVEEVHQDFNRVFALTDQRKETKALREIELFIQDKTAITLTDLYLQMRMKFTKKEIIDALDILVASKKVHKDAKAVQSPTGGLVPVVYLVWLGELAGEKQ